jgi:hypothetical protein
VDNDLVSEDFKQGIFLKRSSERKMLMLPPTIGAEFVIVVWGITFKGSVYHKKCL